MSLLSTKSIPTLTKHEQHSRKKYIVAGNTIDYENSSQEYKNTYRLYSRRYDLVFGEPHGLLMGTEVFLQQMGEKRKPEDVFIGFS